MGTSKIYWWRILLFFGIIGLGVWLLVFGGLDKVIDLVKPQQPIVAVETSTIVPATSTVKVQETPVPTTATSVAVAAPGQPTAKVQPTVKVEPTAVPATSTVPPAPTPKDLPQVVVGFDAFASYYNLLVVKQLGLDEKYGFELVLVPFYLDEASSLDESQRSALMQSGEMDALLTTLDKVALNPGIGKITVLVDETDGADKIIVNPSIQTVNDLRDQRLAYMEGSIGEYMLLYLLNLVQIDPSKVELSAQPDVVAAADLFVSGWAAGVSGWEPDVDIALDAGGHVLIASDRLRVAVDAVVVSNSALVTKNEALQGFHNAWFEALKFQMENPIRAEDLIIGWGNSEWSFVENPGDLTGWLEAIAQASLGQNQLAMSNPRIIVSRLEEARRVWQFAGRQVPAWDFQNSVEPKYVLESAGNPSLATDAKPINDSFLLTSRSTVEKLNAEEIGQAEVLAVLPLEKIDFEPNSTRLTAKAQEDLSTQVIPVLKNSRDVYIRVDGSAAQPGPKGRFTAAETEAFAYERALSVAQYIAGQGIDPNRLILGTIPPKFPESQVESELVQDRIVRFTLVTPAGR